jgi:hypothetical protein
MNCYLCLVETGCDYQPACALCQRCGAGICGVHLREQCFWPVAGLAGGADPLVRYSLICQRCYLAATPSACPKPWPQKKQPQKQRTPSERWWWKPFWRRLPPALPSEDDAVAIAEQFLKQRRKR